MIKEEYVSFEVAKLLKEKGFEGSCDMSYNNKGDLLSNLLIGYGEEGLIIVSNQTIFPYKAPTQQMATAWLREEKGIFINILYGEVGYRYEIVEMDSGIKYSGYWVNSYEEAVEAALKYSLKNLI